MFTYESFEYVYMYKAVYIKFWFEKYIVIYNKNNKSIIKYIYF